ncbi:MAG: hypothetical protein QM296_09960 [Bacillota bacterium]|nr:hypothetical protein [Bacillota bacterium]
MDKYISILVAMSTLLGSLIGAGGTVIYFQIRELRRLRDAQEHALQQERYAALRRDIQKRHQSNWRF